MRAIAILVLPVIVACDSGPIVVDGRYTGTAHIQRPISTLDVVFSMDLDQDGSQVSGTWSAGPIAGSVSGVITASMLVARLTTISCPETLQSAMAIRDAGKEISGSFEGAVCGQPGSATFTATRQ